jgi:hypothetical protein
MEGLYFWLPACGHSSGTYILYPRGHVKNQLQPRQTMVIPYNLSNNRRVMALQPVILAPVIALPAIPMQEFIHAATYIHHTFL